MTWSQELGKNTSDFTSGITHQLRVDGMKAFLFLYLASLVSMW